jgi:hypothetical protein
VTSASESSWLYSTSLRTVGIAGGSNGEAQPGMANNLSITAVSTPAAGNPLYPAGNGDVVVRINHPHAFQVTITAVQVPANAAYAAGCTNRSLSPDPPRR